MAAPSRFLLDTNILVHWTRAKELGQWIEDKYALQSSPLAPLICEVTRGEMLSLALQLGWEEKRLKEMKRILDYCIEIPISLEGVHGAYAQIDFFSQKSSGFTPRNMTKNDLWIAAVAHVTKTPLLSCDKDFVHLHPQWLTLEYVDPDVVRKPKAP